MNRQDAESETLIPTIGGSFNATQPITFGARMSFPQTDIDMAQTLQARNPMAVAQSVAIEYYSHDYCQDCVYSINGISPALNCSQEHTIRRAMQVRRLTPVECERLQGFPDGYTAIAYRNKPASECPDGPRYKALGNSMAVPVMRWIGERIQMVTDGF